jgi:hypothetical protein
MHNAINITSRVAPDTDRLDDLDTRLKQLEIENRQLKEKQKVEIEGLNNKLNAQIINLTPPKILKSKTRKTSSGI